MANKNWPFFWPTRSRFWPFLKILWWADFDLLEFISIYIFVNENQRIYHGTFFPLFFLHVWWYFLFLSLLLFLLRSITGAWKPRKFSHKLQNQRVLRSREYLPVWEIVYPGFTLKTNKKCTRILFIKFFVATKSILLGSVVEKRVLWDVVHLHDTMISFLCTSTARHWSFGSRGFWRFFQRDFAPRVLRRPSPVRDGSLLRGAGNQDHKMCFKIRSSKKFMAPTCFLLDGLVSKWKY